MRDTLAGGFPQIEALSVMSNGQTVTMRDGQAIFLDAATVDPSFFDIAQLPLAHGTTATALPKTIRSCSPRPRR